MAERSARPAYYAGRPGPWGDWWTLLHPPYTLWHISYVAIGASLAPVLDATRLAGTCVAFLLAVGVGAHALDELNGRPLRTNIRSRTLTVVAIGSIVAAVVLGLIATQWVGLGLVPFIVTGAFLVPAYNLEWLGGRLHTDVMFAFSWGAFPVLVSYFAQAESIDVVALLAAAAAFALSAAQRALSTPARDLRRRALRVDAELEFIGGEIKRIDAAALLQPLERALRATSWGLVALAAALVVHRLR